MVYISTHSQSSPAQVTCVRQVPSTLHDTRSARHSLHTSTHIVSIPQRNCLALHSYTLILARRSVSSAQRFARPTIPPALICLPSAKRAKRSSVFRWNGFLSLASAALAFQTHYTPASPPRPACSSGAGVAAPHAMSPRVWRAVYGRRGACVALSICHAHTEEVRETGAAATDSAAASHALRRGLRFCFTLCGGCDCFPRPAMHLGRGVSAQSASSRCAQCGVWPWECGPGLYMLRV